MPDATERFIAAATQPLGDDAEIQMGARRLLAGLIAGRNSPSDDSLGTAADRLAEAGNGRGLKQIKALLFAITAIVSIIVLVKSFRSLYLYRQVAITLSALGSPSSGAAPSYEAVGGHLTEKERLLLLGDIRKRSREEQFKALWDSDPGNPAFFADYATAHISSRGDLPPDFIAVAKQIDPQNAWHLAIAAGIAADEGVTTRGTPVMTPGGVKIGTLRNQAKLDEAIALLHEAAKLPSFENYSEDLIRMRIPLLPTRTDMVSQLPGITYLAGLPTVSIKLRYLVNAVKLKGHQLSQAKDTEGFKRLVADWEKFCQMLAFSRSANLVDVLMNRAVIKAPLEALVESARDLQLQEDARRLSELNTRFEQWKSERKSRPDPNKDIPLRSGLLGGMGVSVASQATRDPVLISPRDLKPGRMADHALADRILSLLSLVALAIVFLAAFLYRFRASRLIRRLSGRMQLLLLPVDWVWIIGAGVILPFLYYHLIHDYTPLGGKNWSLKASSFIVPSGQASALLWLTVLLPLLVARHRLDLRLRQAGLGSGKSLLGWTSAALGLLALPAFGAALHSAGMAKNIFIFSGGMLAAMQIYCLAIGCKSLFGGETDILRRVSLSQSLMPAYAVAMLLAAAAISLHHAREKQWIQADPLLGYSSEAPSLSRYEYDVTQQLQREVLEILDPDADE